MKRILLPAITVLALAAIKCSDDSISSKDKITYDDTITLKAGQSVLYLPDSLGIKFEALLSEGRCPIGAECFWEGMAEIQLQISKPGFRTLNVPLGISGSGQPYPAMALGYRISLIKLTPYPDLSQMPVPELGYEATIYIQDTTDFNVEPDNVIITQTPPNYIMYDPYKLQEMDISGDTLKLTVSYSGGCWLHWFKVLMNPVFKLSNPPQADLYIRHISNNDPCEAYITETLQFDLTPVADLYESMSGSRDSIIINVYDYFENEPGDFLYDIYDPQ